MSLFGSGEADVVTKRGQAALTSLRSADMASPFPAKGLEEHVVEAGLVLEPHLTDQIAATIDADKHLVLIGPPGMNTAGRCEKCKAPIKRPGTILSQMPR